MTAVSAPKAVTPPPIERGRKSKILSEADIKLFVGLMSDGWAQVTPNGETDTFTDRDTANKMIAAVRRVLVTHVPKGYKIGSRTWDDPAGDGAYGAITFVPE